MYKQDLLIEIIKKVQGDNSLNEFSRLSNIDSAYLSRIINRKRTNPPSPKILEKLAKVSKGITNYEELMQMCGYIKDEEKQKLKEIIKQQEEQLRIANEKIEEQRRHLMLLENRLCKTCGRKEHCKWALKGDDHCDIWQTKEKDLKLEKKDKLNFEFKEVN